MDDETEKELRNLRKELNDLEHRRMIIVGTIVHKKKQLADLEKQIEKNINF